MELEKIQNINKNIVFLTKYISGELTIDSRLVSKFISSFPPTRCSYAVYRAEPIEHQHKKYRKRIVSASLEPESAAKGCVSMLRHRFACSEIDNADSLNLDATKLAVYKIENPMVFLSHEEITEYAAYLSQHKLSDLGLAKTEFMDVLMCCNTAEEKECLITPPDKKIMHKIYDLSDPANIDIINFL